MIIAGAGGFAMQLFDTLAELNLENQVVFFDDTPRSENRLIYDKFPVINSVSQAIAHIKKDNRFILGTGNPKIRRMFFKKFTDIGGNIVSIISPLASIGKYKVQIGLGVTILQNVLIESNVSIGMGSLININSAVTHGCRVGDFCELSPGAILTGNCSLGNDTVLGSGVIVLPNVNVGTGVIAAAGAVIKNDVPDNVMVAGVPASIKKNL